MSKHSAKFSDGQVHSVVDSRAFTHAWLVKLSNGNQQVGFSSSEKAANSAAKAFAPVRSKYGATRVGKIEVAPCDLTGA